MENLGLALKISGIGIVVLLLVLILLALIVYLMTRFIVDKEDKEEVVVNEVISTEPDKKSESSTDLQLAAAIAVAIARAQTEMEVSAGIVPAGEVNSWRQFGLQRRLNQSSSFRRTR